MQPAEGLRASQISTDSDPRRNAGQFPCLPPFGSPRVCAGQPISELGRDCSTFKIKIGVRKKVEITVIYRTVAESGDLIVWSCTEDGAWDCVPLYVKEGATGLYRNLEGNKKLLLPLPHWPASPCSDPC